jgi:GNAT superfamily N-acetyltransferase
MARRLRRVLGRAEDLVLVAEAAPAGIIGWIHAAERETLESDQRCEILGLVVDSAHRTRGVGRELANAIERWALGRGLGEIAVRSNVSRVESHLFCQRLGYHRVKTSHTYRKSVSGQGVA